MNEQRLIAIMLSKVTENQFALGAAVEELTHWIEQQGPAEIAVNIRRELEKLEENNAMLTLGVTALMDTDRTSH